MDRFASRVASALAIVSLSPLLGSLGPSPLLAQGTGRITGKIIAVEGGGAVPGAQVMVVGTAITAGSAIDGHYTLLNVPAGTVSIQVRMIGYQPKTVSDIVVPAGGVVGQDVSLEAKALVLEEITVTAAAEKGSVNRALEQQRNADNIISGITAEQISKSPDSDAGQAVQRVSGVTVMDQKYVVVRGLGERYTTTSLNGARVPSADPEKKVVPFDLYPASLLQGITTSKSFTPDQPGDFSGAQVNITTREFPVNRTLTFTSRVGVNLSAVGQQVVKAPTTGTEWRGSPGSARNLPSDFDSVGILYGTTQQQVDTLISSLRDVWTSEQGSGTPNAMVGMSVGGEDPIFQHPFGYLAGFTYSYAQEVRADEQRAVATTGGPINQYQGSTGRTAVLWGGLLNLSTRIGSGSKIALQATYNRSGDNEGILLGGINEEFSQFGKLGLTRLFFAERSVGSGQLSGQHLLGLRNQVDWAATYAKSVLDAPDRSDLIYTATGNAANGNLQLVTWPDIRQSATRTFADIQESGVSATANYAHSFGSISRPTQLKVGAAYRNANRDADSRAYDIRNLTLTVAEQTQAPTVVLGENYALTSRLTLLANSLAGRYTASEDIPAAYAQLNLPVNRWLQLVGGLRVENWQLDMQTYDFNGTLAAPVTRNVTDFLPAIAANIALTQDQNLRLSATQTLARPEYRELSTVPTFEILGGLVSFGNPNLERTLIQNYDARWEWYPKAGEVLSVGVFAKHFNQPIEQVQVASTGAPALSFTNAESAFNYGVELEVRKNLSFVGSQFLPFTFFANGTLMKSQISLGTDSLSSLTNANRPMVGQSPYVLNAGLEWTSSSGRWNAALLYNLFGQRIVEAGHIPLPDTYEEARSTLDASFMFPVFSTLTGKIDGKNLLNSPIHLTQGDVTRWYYRTGTILQFGLTWQP